MKEIVLATRNPGKFRELEVLLNIEDIKLIPISDFILDDVEETGKTFIENALLKASDAALATGLTAIADDSGLEITALGGYPGIYSARCAGENATDEEKRQHILNRMKDIEYRKARFVCAIAICEPTFQIGCVVGRCHGEIATEPRGIADVNVQYDSIFIDPESGLTLAEMPKAEKNKISHRFQAAELVKPILRSII